jgi:hypothetical protein
MSAAREPSVASFHVATMKYLELFATAGPVPRDDL